MKTLLFSLAGNNFWRRRYRSPPLALARPQRRQGYRPRRHAHAVELLEDNRVVARYKI